MKKILVCGSTGFLMSNFIRYLFYMSKDYEIVSVDKIKNLGDYIRLYVHHKHKFYIGDITNRDFMERVVHIEKPDFIINGCFYNSSSFVDVQLGTFILLDYGIPIIHLMHTIKENDDVNLNIKNILSAENTILEFPNAFGFRQRLDKQIPQIVNKCLLKEKFEVGDTKLPWVYAEDIASLIWFLMEKKIKGSIKMPILAQLSEKDIADYILKVFNIENLYEVINKPNNLILNHTGTRIPGWTPDYTDIFYSLDKTIRWFYANRNAFLS